MVLLVLVLLLLRVLLGVVVVVRPMEYLRTLQPSHQQDLAAVAVAVATTLVAPLLVLLGAVMVVVMWTDKPCSTIFPIGMMMMMFSMSRAPDRQ